jgi:molybdopterin converting factor small subunit
MTDVTTTIRLNVRFFAAAGSAAGSETAVLELYPGATVDDALQKLCGQSEELALVLQKCSYLCDGVAVRDRTTVLQPHQTLDVLPPFAGG